LLSFTEVDLGRADIPVILPENDTLVFEQKHLGSGLQSGEVELPDDTKGGATSGLPPINEELVSQLEMMGFPRVRCEKALRATGNSDAESAMEWIFSHMDDPGVLWPNLLSSSDWNVHDVIRHRRPTIRRGATAYWSGTGAIAGDGGYVDRYGVYSRPG
jgi:uncharacterized UBP type Zn finger protein